MASFVDRPPADIEQLEKVIVSIAEKHRSWTQRAKSQQMRDIETRLCEIRQLRGCLCMEQRKATAKNTSKLLKKKARIKAQERVQQLVAERAGVRRFTAFQGGKGNSNHIARVKRSDGEVCEDPHDIADAFADFYTKLYEQKAEDDLPEEECFPIDMGDELGLTEITQQEVSMQAMKLSNGKASDGSNMVIEMVKHAPEEAHKSIAELLTNILKGRTPFPPAWKVNKIWVLFKQGDCEQIKNYRPITLLPILYKLYARIILARVKGDLDKYLSSDSAGYRAGYSCEDHIFVANEVVRQSECFGTTLWIAKLDVSKAFDRVNREALWRTLIEAGLHSGYVFAIRRMYDAMKAAVNVNGVLSKTFHIDRGVRQGDPLSALLFSAVMEFAMQESVHKWETQAKGIEMGGDRPLTNLRFADDMLLFAKSKGCLLQMIQDAEDSLRVVGLDLNVDKTVVLTNQVVRARHVMSLSGQRMEMLEPGHSTKY